MSQPNEPIQPEPIQPAQPLPTDGAPQYAAPAGQPYGQPYGQPGYAAPAGQPYGQPYGQPGYAAPGYPAPGAIAKNWMGITALITSLLGLSLVGVIFGHLGLGAVKRGEANNRGLALAGTIIGYLGLLASIILIILFFVGIGACANDPYCASGFALGA